VTKVAVDVHTHVGEHPAHIEDRFVEEARRAWPGVRLGASLEEHARETAIAERVVVLGFQAHHSGWVVPNDYVAEYVRADPARLVGFGSVDPAREGAVEEVARMSEELGLVGCKLAPIYQGIGPLDPRYLAVFGELERRRLPIVIHQGTTFVRDGPLIEARPILLDEVARRFPELRMIIAHVGHPWCDETIAVIRKHPHVYADISALARRPMQLYGAMVSALEYGALNKLLFGSDWPFCSLEETVGSLRSVNAPLEGTAMPRVPGEAIESILRRPALELLGIPA
jgi:predicted TIM-barrel fold metal-dependent hydrolase